MTAKILDITPQLLTKMESTILSHELIESIAGSNEYSSGWYFYLTLINGARLVFYFEADYQIAFRNFLLKALEVCRAYDGLQVQ